MLDAAPGVPPPGGVKSAIFALLMIETLVWAWRYIRLMYCPRWNSPRAVVGGPGFAGESGPSCAGFQSVQGLPSSSTPAAFPPTPLKGLTVNPAFVDAEPGPCASALNPWGLFVLDRTICVWSSKTNTSDGVPCSANAAGSYISTGLTLKNGLPKASLMAMKDAAKPPCLRGTAGG